MKAVVAIAVVAIVSGYVVAAVLTSVHRTGGDSLRPEYADALMAEMDEALLAVRDGREAPAFDPPAFDAGQHWTVRHPSETGGGLAVLLFTLGTLTVIAANSARPR